MQKIKNTNIGMQQKKYSSNEDTGTHLHFVFGLGNQISRIKSFKIEIIMTSQPCQNVSKNRGL
jgi:hypothetical protein